jgi:Tol biopolymer transport system component
MPDNQLAVLLFIPIGGLLLLMFDYHEEEHTTGHVAGKEKFFLRYNQDEIFKGLLATEGHFRNVQGKGLDDSGFMNCAVKHLADVESHADEAICHSVVVADAGTSEHFKKLRDEVQEFRHDVQDGKVNPSQGIERVRQIRHEFEGFNPDFDISKCKACEVQP